MLRLTLRQARSTAGRLLLAGVAVAMGTGFVAAVLLTSALFTRTVSDSVAAQYRGADVVMTSPAGPLTDAQVAAAASAPGVAAAEGRVDAGVQLVGASGSEYAALRSTSAAPALAGPDRDRLAAGELPAAPGQVALSTSTAERLGVAVGGSLVVRTYPAAPPAPDQGETAVSDVVTQPVDRQVTVVGLLADPEQGLFGTPAEALAVPSDALAWSADSTTDATGAPAVGYGSALVVAAPQVTPEEARDAVATALGATGVLARTDSADIAQGWSSDRPPVDVLTTRQVVDSTVDSALGSTRVLTVAALAFAALALFVATTVITNTFSVLVAQRTRQLALLRCVGATKGQVQRSVLQEAAVLGLAASAVGVLAGAALAAAAAAVLARYAPGVPVPAGVVITPAAVVLPLLVGTGATVLAALAPARAATRVSPLAALRPAPAPDLTTGASRLRLACSLVLVVGGAVLLVLGTLLATGAFADAVNEATGTSDELAVLGAPAAVLGGMASFTGVLLGSVFLVPQAVALVGRLASRVGGAPARLSALNAVRNPRRTASTTGALLIGTTLVALMVVGAATTSRTLAAALDRQFPVDVQVTALQGASEVVVDPATGAAGGTLAGPAGPSLDPAVVAAVEGVPGVAGSALLAAGEAHTRGGPGASPNGETHGVDVVAGTREQLASVVADPAAVDPLVPGTAVLSPETADRLGVRDGDDLELRTTSSGGAATGRSLRVAVTDLGGRQVVLTPEDFTAAVGAGGLGELWLQLAPGADPAQVSGAVQTAVTDATGTGATSAPVSVTGLAAERASFQRVIDTMLLVVVGLLAVAVVIALIGVANTLSLSVIERTRENAVLRALGLTRGQLRRMLALEGALVAGVGGLLGVVLGSLYGWAGAASLLGGMAAAGGDAIWTPSLPWARLGLLLAVAVVAGLLASVLPARRAVRTPPVAALADQ